MKLKQGVNPFGMRPQILLAIIVAEGVWQNHGRELVVTSLNDSGHSLTSLHYDGAAVDFRTNYFSEGTKDAVAAELRTALGDNPDYDIVVEDTHIHLEYQPKRRT